MIAPYPRADARAVDPEADRAMSTVMALITAIRNIRGEMHIAPGVTLAATVRPAPEHAGLEASRRLIETLARAQLAIDVRATRRPNTALAVIGGSEVFVDLAGIVDVAAERQRLGKEIKRASDQIAFLEGKLARPDFVSKAPAEVVEKERERLAEQRGVHDKLVASLGWIDDGAR
jgi:valyl-tRNA synthetase